MNPIFARTSIRKYTQKKVENEKIESLLKAAMAAPSAKNQQPWEFFVVTEKDALAALSQVSPYAGCVKAAPLAIVSCYRKNLPLIDYAEIDMSACTQNILLQAEYLGLGAVWLGVAPNIDRMEAVRNVLTIPDHLNAFAIVSCGYPLQKAQQQNRYDEKRIHYRK